MYDRYADDIIAIIPRDKINEMIDTFDSYHSRLKFTHEYENDVILNFFEEQLIKRNNKIVFYRHHRCLFR